MGSLDLVSPLTRNWFQGAFEAPTPAQEQGWASIAMGQHTLIQAPTGSGKTLAAFLWCLDQLAREPEPDGSERCRVLYVSPLKALAHDVERNLKAPLVGLRLAAQRVGQPEPAISVALRTGDTSAERRRDIARHPPDILITTPESLYLLLTSQARTILRTVRWVIVDEIHSIAATKRGAHLALSLERLEALARVPPQRIGLSATQRPLSEIGRFLGGEGRFVSLVDAGMRKQLDVQIIVPVQDMSRPGGAHDAQAESEERSGPVLGAESRSSIWPAIHPRLLELIRRHRSTLIFVNSRRLAERLALRLNELAGEELVSAHHGSVAREQRLAIEEALKAGALRALVATSSLELGIDMGAIDLVVQVEAPSSVASGLQRIGRAGHSVHGVSSGKVFPKFRGDLLEAAIVVKRMRDGAIETTQVPRNPLDVLAQQIVATCALESWGVDELFALVRRAYNFATLSRGTFESVLDMLAGRYPSDEFSDLKPRLNWDRVQNTVVARNDARVVAVTSGGTIPDRGLFGVFLGEGGPRVGELDEEMVYESRAGETFVLGASTWRIEAITPQRVIVSAAPGEPGKAPFWHGDAIGRPIELGRALGAFVREIEQLAPAPAKDLLMSEYSLDDLAAENLLAYLAEQKAATGALPTDRTIVIERFLDELGDWRVCVLSPFGARVHAPWALAIQARLRERLTMEPVLIWSDDGLAIRVPDGVEPATIEALLFPEADSVEELVVQELGGSALFAGKFRENAARALLLPRRRGALRTPLWQMRQRSAGLLAVASRFGSFPIVLETFRDCLQDVFDIDALREVLLSVEQRRTRIVSVETPSASPFAGSLLFDYVAEFIYQGDAPLAEKRAQALTLDRERLRELLGQEELRELLDGDALGLLELELQGLADRRVRTADQLHDLLRRLGDLTAGEIAARCEGTAPAWLATLESERRAARIRLNGAERWIAAEDVGRYRDALGIQPPRGIPEAFLGPTLDPLGGILARYARGHGPFLAYEPAGRWGIPPGLVEDTLRRMGAASTLLQGEFRPNGTAREWCDPDVLRALRRRSLARLRKEVEPVAPEALARFLAAWQGIGSDQGGADRLMDVLSQLEGAYLPWSMWERDVLPARVRGYQPRLLDELCASGEVVWIGGGAIASDDGRVALFRRDRTPATTAQRPETAPDGDAHERIRAHLAERGASFFRELVRASGLTTDAQVLAALWELVWSGEVTNDTVVPLRLRHTSGPRTGMRRPPRLSRLGPPEGSGRWSLVRALPLASAAAVSATDSLYATTMGLLERFGVVARETALSEAIGGGFSAIYPLLRSAEEAGKVRRGYFVEGLGAAQFALSAAVERLRASREVPEEGPGPLVIGAADPANPYGTLVPWPCDAGTRRLLQRTSGAYAVLLGGVPALYLDRSHKRIITLPGFASTEHRDQCIRALASVAEISPHRELGIERIDGESILGSPLRPAFEAAGFAREYLGLTYRPEPLHVGRARTA